MDTKIKKWISDYVREESKREEFKNLWGNPVVGLADAGDPMFQELKKAVSENHLLPGDLLPDATAVVAYYIPFTEELAAANIQGRTSSREWAVAYRETNDLIGRINAEVYGKLSDYGYSVAEIPATRNFDEEKLISDWSHRHIAYVAGLGTFGLNNLLITEKGCCGRIGSFVTNAKLDKTKLAAKRPDKEHCLYRRNETCWKCVDRCVNGSLAIDGLDRKRCYELLLYNDRIHKMDGLGEVCGKCNVDLPCAHRIP